MKNELQQVLDDILDDKTTNLKPGNLRQDVTCLGVEGTAEVPIPIYETTDYSAQKIPIPEGETSLNYLDYWSFLGDYALIYGNSSEYYPYLYKKVDNTWVCLGKIKGALYNAWARCGIAYYNNDYLWITQTNRNSNQFDLNKVNLSDLSVEEIKDMSGTKRSFAEYSEADGKGNVLTNSMNNLYCFHVDYNNNSFTFKQTDGGELIKRFTYVYNISYASQQVKISQVNPETWEVKQGQTPRVGLKIYGITFDETRVFTNDGIYYLNPDFTFGEKITDLNIEVTKEIYCINDKYYVYKNGIYTFDMETNEFSLVFSSNSALAIKNNIVVSLDSIYEFDTSNTVIGYTINNKTVYLNSDAQPVSSNALLEGYSLYTQLYQPISGTMKNNGDVTIAPTTSEQIKEQGYYNSLKINPVTSDIDENIKPENIKKDVSILGVTGSLEASGGSDVTPIYETTEYTVKNISVDLNEEVDSISTYEQYVVVHTTLNKLKVYNKSNLTEPLMSLDDVSLPYQQFMYVFDKVDDKLYISFGDDGTAEQAYWIADLTSNNITKGTYTNTLDSTQDNDVHIDRLNHLVHYKHGRYSNYCYIYSYDAIQGFTQLADVYNHFGSYIGNNVYENSKNIIIINNNGSYSDYNVVPSSMNYDVSGLNYTKTKAFVYSYDDYKSLYVYSLNDDYSLNELLGTIELSFEFTNGRPIFQCLNSNYYYLSYNENNYILKFDEDTNQFSIVVTNEKLYIRNSLPVIRNNNQYIDFQQGDTEIGILYNGNQYLTRDKYTGYTNSDLLTGNTMYDIAHQIVAGTMANNGDVVITPTTQEQTKEQGYYNSLKVSAVTSDIDSNIVPENIKKDVSILGVNGTLETGTDTSDATATSNDIVSSKTAYVNGEKVTGNIPKHSAFGATGQIQNGYNDSILIANSYQLTEPVYISDSFSIELNVSQIAEFVGLTPDKIKAGETILGITGTYEGTMSTEE